MRLFLVTAVLWAVVGCQGTDAGAGAVRVELFYATFRPGCLRVTATDAADAGRSETQRLSVESRSGLKTVAVFRQPSWSRELQVTARAQEGSCDGPEVATSTQTVQVPESGAVVVRLDLRAADLDGDGFVAKRSGGTDCDDEDASVYPGAPETCDGKDSNCSGDESDATDPREYFVDADRDGYCSLVKARGCPPAGPPCQPGDCRDDDARIHPGQVESRCDGVDENCDGQTDESFQVGSACQPQSGCPSTRTCAADQRSSECVSTQSPQTWYQDQDGDGRFGTPVGPVCAQPPNSSTAPNDCDDTSRFIGGAEVCDRLDNDCNGQTDEGTVCGAVSWSTRTVGPGSTWSAVATDARGKVWLAGAGGALGRVEGGVFTDRSTACTGTHDWTRAWARPSDGRLFLTSAQGELVTLTSAGTDCSVKPLDTSVSGRLTGLTGFERGGATTVYAVTSGGDIVRWDWRDATSSAPQAVARVAANLRAIQGTGPDALLAVGAEDYQVGSVSPRVFRRDPSSERWSSEALPASAGAILLRGVSVVDARLAYAVGDEGRVLRWKDGAWSDQSIPGVGELRDVVAFHPKAVLVLARSSTTPLYLYDGQAWSSPYTPVPAAALEALSAVGPEEQWAAGENGTRVHWGP